MSKNLTKEETERVLKNMLRALGELPSEKFVVRGMSISDWVYGGSPRIAIEYRYYNELAKNPDFGEAQRRGVSEFYNLAKESQLIDFDSFEKVRVDRDFIDISAYMPKLGIYLTMLVWEREEE